MFGGKRALSKRNEIEGMKYYRDISDICADRSERQEKQNIPAKNKAKS